MAVSREAATRLALDTANRIWGYPTADEELVILHEWAEESELAWAFTRNARTYAQTGDIMRALGVGNGPIIVAKATGEACPMSSAYGCREALRVWQQQRSS